MRVYVCVCVWWGWGGVEKEPGLRGLVLDILLDRTLCDMRCSTCKEPAGKTHHGNKQTKLSTEVTYSACHTL